MNRARLVAYAQIALSVMFLGGYFAVLGLFLLGLVKTDPQWKDALIALLGVITGAVGVIMAFWFNRSRNESTKADDDPNENLVS